MHLLTTTECKATQDTPIPTSSQSVPVRRLPILASCLLVLLVLQAPTFARAAPHGLLTRAQQPTRLDSARSSCILPTSLTCGGWDCTYLPVRRGYLAGSSFRLPCRVPRAVQFNSVDRRSPLVCVAHKRERMRRRRSVPARAGRPKISCPAGEGAARKIDFFSAAVFWRPEDGESEKRGNGSSYVARLATSS